MNIIKRFLILMVAAVVVSVSIASCSKKSEKQATEQSTKEKKSTEHPTSEHPSNEDTTDDHPSGNK